MTIPTTHIVVLLDQSGSMVEIKADAIGSYNQYLQEQQSAALPGDTWTLTTFEESIRVRHAGLPVAAAPFLTPETYRPQGTTALHDAIVMAAGATERRVATGDRVLFVIITDGEENSSTTATLSDVKTLIDRLTAAGNWTFVYLAANVDAFATGGHLGIAAGNTLAFAATGAGTQSVMDTLTSSTAHYRASGAAASSTFFSVPEPDQDTGASQP